MTPKEFCHWLSGYFELGAASDGPTAYLTAEQVDIIQKRAKAVVAPAQNEEASQAWFVLLWITGFLDRSSGGVSDLELPVLKQRLVEAFKEQNTTKQTRLPKKTGPRMDRHDRRVRC